MREKSLKRVMTNRSRENRVALITGANQGIGLKLAGIGQARDHVIGAEIIRS
jgi:hypothetical protein